MRAIRRMYEGRVSSIPNRPCTVTVNGVPIVTLDERNIPRQYSWGHRGSGPHAVAEAITLHFFGHMFYEVRDILLDQFVCTMEQEQPWTLLDVDIETLVFLHNHDLWEKLRETHFSDTPRTA